MIIVYYAGYRHILPTIDATHTDAYLDLKEVTLHFHYDPISDMITLHSDVELTPYSTQPLTDDHASTTHYDPLYQCHPLCVIWQQL